MNIQEGNIGSIKLNEVDLGLGGGSLTQVANRSWVQGMSYIIETPAGETIIIDGGYLEDADFLYEEIKRRGGRVHAWFLTHPHVDHIGVLTQMLQDHPKLDIQIDGLYFHFPERDFIFQKPGAANNQRFFAALSKHVIPIFTPNAGDVIPFGGLSVEIVHHPVEYHDYPHLNPTSMIMRIHFPKRDVLILGDFDVNAQEEYLKLHDVSKLRCDIVQMAHHGEDGIDREFYALIAPKICLYPTTIGDRKYPNEKADAYKAAGEVSSALYDVWQWMEALGATASYSFDEGDWKFI